MATTTKVIWYDDRIIRTAEKRKEAFLIAAGKTVLKQAVINITTQKAVRTGRLRGSLIYHTRRDRSAPVHPATEADTIRVDPGDDTVSIGTNVEYGPWIEFGVRRRTRARPYLRPALTMSKNAIRQLARRILRF